MPETTPMIDAGLFLAMHHRDEQRRHQSLAFFRSHFSRRVHMNFEQVGICDAVIWEQPRQVQDDYYPFMDRLHSDMQIVRKGYRPLELKAATNDSRLRDLRPDRALLAAQLLCGGRILYTHDRTLHALPFLKPHLGDMARLDQSQAFPAELEALYRQSQTYTYSDKDLENVETGYSDTVDYAS